MFKKKWPQHYIASGLVKICFRYFGKLPKFFLPRISSENKKSTITQVLF